ncbi:MAG: 2-dehydropantoate 2-reductase [Actinomycetota bacterium]
MSVGAGAVGGVIAARLVRSGVDLSVFDTNERHVDLIRSRGVIVDGLDGGTATTLDAVMDPPSKVFDVVLLAVRSHHTADALNAVDGAIGDATDVVSLQNGINEDVISDAVGAARTIGCVVGFGSTWIEPGRIELNAEGDLRIGRLDGSQDARLHHARELLDAAFPTKITDNIRGALWAKMLVNSMTVLGALGGMLTGDVLGTPERRRIVARVVAEGVRVARAEGVRLPNVFGVVSPELVDTDEWEPALDAALQRIRPAIGAIRSVTWRDFEIGRPTEVDAVTGEIVRRRERLGVPTPLSEVVFARLKEIEQGDRAPTASNLDGL